MEDEGKKKSGKRSSLHVKERKGKAAGEREGRKGGGREERRRKRRGEA